MTLILFLIFSVIFPFGDYKKKKNKYLELFIKYVISLKIKFTLEVSQE